MEIKEKSLRTPTYKSPNIEILGGHLQKGPCSSRQLISMSIGQITKLIANITTPQ